VQAGTPLTLIKSDFRNLVFPADVFDIVTATNALYFLPPVDFPAFWRNLVGWVRPGGIFIGQFMGPRDAWANREDYTVHSSEAVKVLFDGFELLYFLDDDRDSVNLLGKDSHVHVIHAVARKRSL
jgi:SAM-dependent methyltransferase